LNKIKVSECEQRPSEKKNRRIETALKFKFRGCPGYLGQPLLFSGNQSAFDAE